MIFFESARRVHQTLSDLARSFGPDRQAAIARELSKLYEETINGTLAELNEIAAQREFKGEITIAVQGAPDTDESSEPDSAGLEELLDMGLGVKQASEIIARLRGGNKREIYQRALSIRKRADD